MSEKILAESSFDLPTSGLWAQHAPTAPLCSPEDWCLKLTSLLRVAPQKTNWFHVSHAGHSVKWECNFVCTAYGCILTP